MTLLYGTLLPHPPLLIPEIGGDERQAAALTDQSMRTVAKTIARLQPDTLVIISPHGLLFEDTMVMMGGEQLQGSFAEFDVPRSIQVANDIPLLEEAYQLARQQDVPLEILDDALKARFGLEQELDYGALVPLSYMLEEQFAGSVLHLSVGLLTPLELYRVGMVIRQAAARLGRRIAVIASGDNAHTLSHQAPLGFHPEGERFDQFLSDSIRDGRWMEVMLADPQRRELAAEDTIPSLTVMFGCFEETPLQAEVLSYEAPYGVGYTVAQFLPQTGKAPSLYEELTASLERQIKQRREQESAPVRVARMAVEHFVEEDEYPDLETVYSLGRFEPDTPSGVFVTIKKHGRLRGCIGSVVPTKPTLTEEIIHHAILSCSEDDRFFPVEPEELDHLTYSVDILQPFEPIESVEQLDPSRYGVIVQKANRSGLLLPMLAGIGSAEQQVAIAKEKAGIAQDDPDVELYRFEVIRYV